MKQFNPSTGRIVDGDDGGGPNRVWLPWDPYDQFEAYISQVRARAADLDAAWFKVPYRSKREGIAALFELGAEPYVTMGQWWTVIYVPVDADIRIHSYLLTHQGQGWRILVAFQSDDQFWFDPAHRHTNLVSGLTRKRRIMLRRVAESAVFQSSLLDMYRRFAALAHADSNPQARAYLPALFNAWLSERSIVGEDADALRLLAGLGDPFKGLELMREYGT